MISIIVSTYNRPERLKQAIQSVIDQTFQDWECIVVSDGHSDANSDIVKGFTNNKIKYFEIDHFGCDTKPKNYGIMQSKGDCIAFLDDDVRYKPEHLFILHKNIIDSGADIVYGDRFIFNELDPSMNTVGIHNDYNPHLLMQRNYIDTSDVLIKRECLFRVGGFDEKVKKFIDWNLWIRMSKAGFNFMRIPVIITDYVIHKEMKSIKIPNMDITFHPLECEIDAGYLGEKQSLKVAIFTLTKDRLDLTKKMFETMWNTNKYPYDHYIVDNGSTDGTKEYLEALWRNGKIKHIIYNSENKGIAVASNQALDVISDKYDIIGKVDNDIHFKTEGWLDSMISVFNRNMKMVLSPYVEGLINNAGGVLRDGYGLLGGELLGLVRHLGGCSIFSPYIAYKDWRWPDHARKHGGNDVMFSIYCRQNMFNLAYLENHRVGHYTEDHKKLYPEYYGSIRKQEQSESYVEANSNS